MWVNKAVSLRFDNNIAWTKLPEMLNKEFDLHLTYDQVRDKLRQHPRYKQTQEVVAQTISNELLLESLKKEREIESLCEQFSVAKRVLLAYVDDLKEQGYQITECNGLLKICNIVIPSNNRHKVNWNGDSIIRFGVVSDTHIGSKWFQLGFLQELYKTFKYEGIERVYHVGDMTEGFYKNRAGHIYELEDGCLGASGQIDKVCNFYPDDVPTDYILGNHDATHIMNGGILIGDIISLRRPDMKFLGYDNATIDLTPNCNMELVHPKDGSSYAQSYQLQRYADSLSGGDKKNIVLCGHYHKMFYMFYRNMHMFACGCIESQTPFMKGKKLSAHIGGMIIEVHVDKQGTITRCKNEFIPCYNPVNPKF